MFEYEYETMFEYKYETKFEYKYESKFEYNSRSFPSVRTNIFFIFLFCAILQILKFWRSDSLVCELTTSFSSVGLDILCTHHCDEGDFQKKWTPSYIE